MWTFFKHNKQRVAWCFMYIMLAMVVSKGLHFHKEGTCCGLSCSINVSHRHNHNHSCSHEHHKATIKASRGDTTPGTSIDHCCAVCSFLVVLVKSPISTFCCVSQTPLLERSIYKPLYIILESVDSITARGPPSYTDYLT